MTFDLLDLLGWLGLAVLVWVVGRAVWGRLRPPPPPVLPPDAETIPLPLPEGAWEAFNSPASKVPSHGTDGLAQRYAIDIVGTEPGVGHTRVRDWRSLLWLEPPERFTGFVAPVVAPTAGTVISVYDGWAIAAPAGRSPASPGSSPAAWRSRSRRRSPGRRRAWPPWSATT